MLRLLESVTLISFPFLVQVLRLFQCYVYQRVQSTRVQKVLPVTVMAGKSCDSMQISTFISSFFSIAILQKQRRGSMWNTLDVSSLFRSSIGSEINRATLNDSINVSELEFVAIRTVNHRWTTQITLIVIPFLFLSTVKRSVNVQNR